MPFPGIGDEGLMARWLRVWLEHRYLLLHLALLANAGEEPIDAA